MIRIGELKLRISLKIFQPLRFFAMLYVVPMRFGNRWLQAIHQKREVSIKNQKREKQIKPFHCSPNFGCNVTGRLTALMTAMRLEFGWTVPIEDISRSLTSLLGQMIWKWPIRNWIKSGHNSIWMWSSSVSMRFKFEIPEKRSTWINEVLWCLR